MTYPEALDYIAALSHRGWRLGLDRMEEFLRRAGLDKAIGGPGEIPHFIHVAGTNGKGSATASLESMLRHSGYRTGGFFSPYVYDIRERIQADGALISMEDMVRLTERLAPIEREMESTKWDGPTEFEFKTAMGFAFWREQAVDWVALEVGLGGRLDATNVVRPAATAIVSIGLDHTAILGDTVEEIAAAKAGIFKAGVPAVVGRLPDAAQGVVERIAAEVGCPLWTLGREVAFEVESEGVTVRTPMNTYRRLETALAGRHQLENMAVAVAAMDAAGASRGDEGVRRGLAEVVIPGRFERRKIGDRLVILDGAHNTESMAALAETLTLEYPGQRFDLVFGMVEGHDPSPVGAILSVVCERAFITPIDFRRSQAPQALAPSLGMPFEICRNSQDAIERALANSGGPPILVTGSFYLVGEVGNWLSRTSG